MSRGGNGQLGQRITVRERTGLRSRARTLASLGAVAGIVGVVGMWTAPAGASNTGAFAAFAQAQGVLASISNPSLPLGLVIQGPGPDATVSVDSLGTSDASASFPYLGAGVQGVPGLAGTLFGFPLPAYPFQSSTNAGQRPADVSGPGFALHAESPGDGAMAKATAGTDAIGVNTTARIERRDDGTIAAEADSTVSLVNVAGLISLHGVHSHAEVSADPSTGKLTKSSYLSIGQISAPGLSLTLPTSTPGTVPLPIPVPGLPQLPPLNLPRVPVLFGGQTIVGPEIGFENGSFTITIPGLGSRAFAIPAKPVLGAFKALGIGLAFESPEESTSGVAAPAMRVETRVSLPSSRYLQGTTEMSTTLGKATVSLDIHPVAIPPAVAPPPFTSPPAVTGSPVDLGTPSASMPPPSVPVPAVAILPAAGAPAMPLSAPLPATTPIVGVAAQSPLWISYQAKSFYPILVIVAGVAFAAAQFLRLKGVRSEWGS